MPFMTATDPDARDGTAGSLMGAFDFTQPARPADAHDPRVPLSVSPLMVSR